MLFYIVLGHIWELRRGETDEACDCLKDRIDMFKSTSFLDKVLEQILC